MRPLTFINGVLLGSSGALASVIGVILFFRWTLTSDPSLDQTVVTSDLPLGELLRDMCIFMVLALLALAAFLGELRMRRWRLAADYALAVALVGVAMFFFAGADTRARDLALLGVTALAGLFLYGVARALGWTTRISAWLGD
ncbi:MAG TPA: hypothetical protein VLV87_01550 [Gammaproteobacteria bacterium]|nr:hypothetical protein [Gammaproteobacteria bacterium]